MEFWTSAGQFHAEGPAGPLSPCRSSQAMITRDALSQRRVKITFAGLPWAIEFSGRRPETTEPGVRTLPLPMSRAVASIDDDRKITMRRRLQGALMPLLLL